MDHSNIEQNSLAAVLPYWFGDIAQDKPFDMQSIYMQRWYGKSPDIDAEIKTRFEPLFLDIQIQPERGSVQALPVKDQLAAIIVLDQFPRNMYRDTGEMYASDPLALGLAQQLLAKQYFYALDLFKQMFAALPLMHAEQLAQQTQMLAHFERFMLTSKAQASPNKDFFENAFRIAQRHYDIIERFGRFPHRNVLLGRKSTIEEVEFLKQTDSAF